MKPDEPWLRACKRLAIGATKRYRCCGATPAAVLYNNPQSWDMYCNRCKQTVKKRKEAIRIQAPVMERAMQPVPAQLKRISQVSADEQHRVWTFLQRKGLDPLILPSDRFMLAAGRLVIPFGGGVFGRSLSPQLQPKWVQYAGPESNKVARFLWLGVPNGEYAVIVEDQFSAIKLAYASNMDITVYCSLGTRAHVDLRAAVAAAGHKRVLVWYDGDLAGEAGCATLRKALRPFTQVRTLTIPGKDPKDLQLPEIKEVLNGLCTG